MEIDPGTKVFDLLRTYPFLEEDLILIHPGFKRLKNPVLRNTVARFVSLRQAAFVAGLDVEDLVSYLRRRVGQSPLEEIDGSGGGEAAPAWLSKEPAIILDVQRLLKKSQNPHEALTRALEKVEAGEVVLLRSPFLPRPLMEMMEKEGIEVFGARAGADYFTYFRKPN